MWQGSGVCELREAEPHSSKDKGDGDLVQKSPLAKFSKKQITGKDLNTMVNLGGDTRSSVEKRGSERGKGQKPVQVCPMSRSPRSLPRPSQDCVLQRALHTGSLAGG